MIRFRLLVIRVLFVEAVLLFGGGARVTHAGPMNVSFEEWQVFGELSERTSKPAENPPRPDAPPAPASAAAPDEFAIAASSMGSTSSVSPSSSSAPPAALIAAALPQPSLHLVYTLVDEFLFIPPRFLDGVFRPPRSLKLFSY